MKNTVRHTLNTVWHRTKSCSTLATVADRDSAKLQAYLELTVLRLKETKDPKIQQDLLLEMRRLLEDADRLLLESTS